MGTGQSTIAVRQYISNNFIICKDMQNMGGIPIFKG